MPSPGSCRWLAGSIRPSKGRGRSDDRRAPRWWAQDGIQRSDCLITCSRGSWRAAASKAGSVRTRASRPSPSGGSSHEQECASASLVTARWPGWLYEASGSRESKSERSIGLPGRGYVRCLQSFPWKVGSLRPPPPTGGCDAPGGACIDLGQPPQVLGDDAVHLDTLLREEGLTLSPELLNRARLAVEEASTELGERLARRAAFSEVA